MQLSKRIEADPAGDPLATFPQRGCRPPVQTGGKMFTHKPSYSVATLAALAAAVVVAFAALFRAYQGTQVFWN